MSHEDDPAIWLVGKRAALGSLDAKFVKLYWKWENDPAAIRGYGRRVPEPLEARVEGFGHQVRGGVGNARFTVYSLEDETPKPVGMTTLLIDHQVATAEFIILMAPEARGRGLGTEATRLTLDYAFHLTNLRMVHLKVLEPNTAGIRAYERAGFRHAGRLRNAGGWNGRRCDELFMDALPEEFQGPSVIVT